MQTCRLTVVTLVSTVSGVAVTAEGAPLPKALSTQATGGTSRRHTHSISQTAPGGTVHTLRCTAQVIHLTKDTHTHKNESESALWVTSLVYIDMSYSPILRHRG